MEDSAASQPGLWQRRLQQIRTHARSVDYFVTKHPDEADLFSIAIQLRILAAISLRAASHGLALYRGRGVARVITLQAYAFVLLFIGAVKRHLKSSRKHASGV